MTGGLSATLFLLSRIMTLQRSSALGSIRRPIAAGTIDSIATRRTCKREELYPSYLYQNSITHLQ